MTSLVKMDDARLGLLGSAAYRRTCVLLLENGDLRMKA